MNLDSLVLLPAERAELIDRLFQSNDAPHKIQIDTAWGAEFESSLDACKKGKIKASMVGDVMARINGR